MPGENPQSTGRVILTAIGGTLFGLALGLAIVAALATRFFNYHILTVESGSMAPTLKKGDIVVIRPNGIDKVKSGDIIYFAEANTGVPFVHRALGIGTIVLEVHDKDTDAIVGERKQYQITTKGDANAEKDGSTVGIENYRGQYWFRVPTGGILGGGVNPSWLLLGLAAIIGVGWAAWEASSRRAKPAKKRRRISRPVNPTTALRFMRDCFAAVALWFVARADDLLYYAWRGLRPLWYRLRGRPGPAETVMRAGPVRLPHGAILWMLLPAAVWAGALVLMLGNSAGASDSVSTDGPWEDRREGAGVIQVITPTPTPIPAEAASEPTTPSGRRPNTPTPVIVQVASTPTPTATPQAPTPTPTPAP
ncbi:MAG: signal peptidase I [Dehalococcoidia bacterium]